VEDNIYLNKVPEFCTAACAYTFSCCLKVMKTQQQFWRSFYLFIFLNFFL